MPRDLQNILDSGEVESIQVGGTDPGELLMTSDEIDARIEAAVSKATLWQGAWVPETSYLSHDMVLDGTWLMIANKDTDARPAPQPVNEPQDLFPADPVWAEAAFVGVVHTGHKITLTKAGWLTSIKVWVPELTGSTNYRFILSDITVPAYPITVVIEEPVLFEDAWTEIRAGRKVYGIGTVFLIIIDALNSGDTTPFGGNWTYGGTSPTGAPATSAWNRNNGHSHLRINSTDLAVVDRSNDLMNGVAGSTIRFSNSASPDNFLEYRVNQSPTDEGTYIDYPAVTLINQGGTLNASDETVMILEAAEPQATKSVEEVDYWTTHGDPDWATVEGYKEQNGVPIAGVEDDAFGVDLEFQEASVSPDWDIAAYSGG